MVTQSHSQSVIRSSRLVPLLLVLVGIALGAAFYFVRADAGGPRLAGQDAVSLAGATSPKAASAPDADYQLEKLPVLSRVIIEVKNNYVDPKRIDPKAMVVAALDMVEKAVAEVMVDGDAKGGKLTVTVGSARQVFDISKVGSIFDVRMVLGEVMGFIQKHLVAHTKLREIEYAACNGLLSTLDPHSVLLEPRFFKEMKLQTKGEFGGLGFVIQMREGELTVVKVLKNTPAQRAGIKAKDVISKIEEQSTINMDLQDAVDRLRGKPGTKVSITVRRVGWNDPKRLSIAREVINVETVTHAKVLDRGVGYVKVSQFSANTARDLFAALQHERAQAGGQLKGLILDLRGNPGGLLDQAIQVSDLFLADGVIVKTVGDGERLRIHEVKEAHSDPTDLTDLPLVVLVNNSSASASEIVAGALKNNNRALVVGRQTFGKGSVQVLYDHDFADLAGPNEELALKLTIAQYLTPGDLSIQEVGVLPDVMLLPGRALEGAVSYFAPPVSVGEVDLDRHFSNPTGSPSGDLSSSEERKQRREQKAPLELRYLLDEKEDPLARSMKEEEQRKGGVGGREDAGPPEDVSFAIDAMEEENASDANPDELVEDYPIRFAKSLLARAPFTERSKLLDAAKSFVAERRGEEEARLREKLTRLGVDWSSGSSAGGAPRVNVTVSPAAGQKLAAGTTVPWTVTVENRGDAPLQRLRAWSLVEKNPLLDHREFIFGNVKPGEKRSWTVPIKLTRSIDSRRDSVVIHFEGDGGRAPPDVTTTLDVGEAVRPAFVLSTQIDDRSTGNGDGLAERSEEITLRVDVKNQGSGTSDEKTYVSLKNLGDEKIFIKKGRAVIGPLKPGEVKSAELQLEVRKGLKDDKFPLRVMVVDDKSDEYVSDKLEIPVQNQAPAKVAARGGVRVTGPRAFIRGGASSESAPLAVAMKGSVLPVSDRLGNFYKVEWKKGRFGFVSSSEVIAGGGSKRRGSIVDVWQVEPPSIAVNPNPAKGAPVVDAEQWKLTGSASVPPSIAIPGRRLQDIFVFVNDQKVFFKIAEHASGPSTRMDFQADIPLKAGNNVVTVVARENEDLQTRRTIMVYRRGQAEVARGAE